MTERFSSWFPLLLLAVIAALSFWLDQLVQPPAGPPAHAPKGEPDYIVNGLSAVRMDRDGRVKHTLRAQKMTHYADDDMTLLVEPKFVSYSESTSPVTVTSREARV